MVGRQARFGIYCLLLAAVGNTAAAQGYEGSASPGSYHVGYSTRPLTLPEGRLRIDLAPPDYGYMDHGELNNNRGLKVRIPDEGDARVGLGVGGAYGILDEFEAGGLIFPFVFAPDFDFGDMELYARYAFLRGAAQLAVQPVLRIPTASDFALGIGMPAQFRLGGSVRLDTGVELELIFANNARINLDVPLAVNVNIGRTGFIGGRTGLLFYDFEEMAINLGIQGGAAVHRMVDLTASVNFPYFLTTAGDDPVRPDVEIIMGANIFVDLM